MHVRTGIRRLFCLAFVLGLHVVCTCSAQAEQTVQCFSLEFFYDSSVNDAAELRLALETFAEKRTGLKVSFRDVNGSEKLQERTAQIAKYFGLSELKLPAIYGLKNVLAGLKSETELNQQLELILTLTAYVRNGCPHCQAAKSFLGRYGARYPALRIVYKEVVTDANARREMDEVVQRYRQRAASLPVIHYCNGLTIGFDRDTTTASTILKNLDYWSSACPVKKNE